MEGLRVPKRKGGHRSLDASEKETLAQLSECPSLDGD